MPRILVIGESCRDIFLYCDATRLAPDLPVPILRTIHTDENPGMAANVFRNIRSKQENCELITNPGWENITKTRFMHEKTNHMFLRVDSGEYVDKINFDAIDDLSAELVVIADYNKGFLSESDIEQICANNSNVFLDTKKILGDWAAGANYIKINDFEYKNSENLISKELRQKIIHTVGQFGCNFQGINYPVAKHEIRDTSGAGDSFMAALVVDYLITGDIISSLKSANLAASEIVKYRGVGVI